MLFENLGPYKIERLIGRGGMGAVYEGVHHTTGARHAIKTLALALTDDEGFRQRFEIEILSMKDLAHGNIVRLISQPGADGVPLYLMEQQGVLFYAMEFVNGPNLHELLREKGRLPWREVVGIALQVCAALKHAHAHGTIHRDLKPANLVIDRTGQVKLTDFGIARFFDVAHLTLPGGVIGTADYMSPEQAEGKPVDTMTDLYSLGAVLYALMTGKPPFTGRTATEVITRLRSETPTPICKVAPDVPVELGMIVDQLLAKSPADRVSTLRLLENRLNATLHGLARNEEIAGDRANHGDEESSDESSLEPHRPIDDDEDTFVGSSSDGDSPENTGPLDGQPTAGAPGDRSPNKDNDQSHSPDNSLTESGGSQDTGRGGGESGTGSGRRGGGGTSEFRNSEEGDDQPSEHATVADDRSYTLVDLRQGRSTGIRIDGEAFRHHNPVLSVLSNVALVAGLIGVIYFVWYLSQPPAADALFNDISVVAIEGDPKNYIGIRRKMERFVASYDSDDNTQLVQAMIDDHDGYRRWKSLQREARLEGGIQALPESQRLYVEAMRLRASKPLDAIQRLTEFASKYREHSGDGVSQLVAWADATAIVLEWQASVADQRD